MHDQMFQKIIHMAVTRKVTDMAQNMELLVFWAAIWRFCGLKLHFCSKLVLGLSAAGKKKSFGNTLTEHREEMELKFQDRVPSSAPTVRWRNFAAEVVHIIASLSCKAKYHVQRQLAVWRTQLEGHTSRNFGSVSSVTEVLNSRLVWTVGLFQIALCQRLLLAQKFALRM
jgi:hypothetical protein